MSGQWEVVGKNKKDKQNNKKLTKSEKQKFIDNAPKVEDLLPLSQIKTLYSALDIKETNKNQEKALKTKENEAKKAQKKQPEKKKEKEPVKEKPPKNLEAAVGVLTLENVSLVIENGKLRFGDAPLVWLKNLASFLNMKLPVEHREINFTSKSFDHPLWLLPTEIRNYIKKEIKDVPDPVIQTFYDYCLVSMTNDMTKGTPICGYKILLQLIGIQYPGVTVMNLDKSIALKNSYQNRQAIGLSILWALGQGGFKNISIGLRVWQEVMLPLCELRHYTRYVLDYLKHLLARHSTSKGLGSEQFFSILDSMYSPHLKLSHAVSTELKSYTKPLREIACNQSERRLHLYYEPLLERMLSASIQLRDELVRFCVTCLIHDPNTLTIWRELYKDNLQQSAWILKSLNSDWPSAKEKIPGIVTALNGFKSINDSMARSNQKAAGLQDCSRLSDVLLNKKMTTRKSGFPIFKFIFVVTLAFAGFIAYQVNTYGSLRASPTGKLLKDTGAVEVAEATWLKSKVYYNQTHQWTVKNGPIYYKKISEASKPYVKIISDYAVIAYKHVKQCLDVIYAYVVEKLPFVGKWVDTYAPSKEFFYKKWDLLSHYSIVVLKVCLQYGIEVVNFVVYVAGLTFNWLQKNVFVGNFSSENLQKYAVQGFNATYKYASQTYFWVQDKLITLYT